MSHSYTVETNGSPIHTRHIYEVLSTLVVRWRRGRARRSLRTLRRGLGADARRVRRISLHRLTGASRGRGVDRWDLGAASKGLRDMGGDRVAAGCRDAGLLLVHDGDCGGRADRRDGVRADWEHVGLRPGLGGVVGGGD